jgi:hypothetical protein
LVACQLTLTNSQLALQLSKSAIDRDGAPARTRLAGRDQPLDGSLLEQIVARHADAELTSGADGSAHAGEHLEDHRGCALGLVANASGSWTTRRQLPPV